MSPSAEIAGIYLSFIRISAGLLTVQAPFAAQCLMVKLEISSPVYALSK